MLKSPLAALGLAALTTSTALAGAPNSTTIYSDADTTKAFVGLNLSFGAGGMTPEGVLGVATGETDTSNDFTGASAALHFGLGDFGLRSVRITGLAGDPDTQGEIGLGYSFADRGIFGVGGINTQYFRAGADLGFDGSLSPYFGVQSLDGFDERDEEIRNDNRTNETKPLRN
ncbi:hypothetical protein [Rhodosalinus sediminis]|uniref:hypothetical protein n=1 Tax=Rhodosalinus sediminis TaxID=1940533 RepID=UPI002352F9F3|nr:hypothetical protein [Rhodosalinus sediminis]